MLSLQQPRHIPTLPIATQMRCPRYVRLSLNFRHDVEASRTTRWAISDIFALQETKPSLYLDYGDKDLRRGREAGLGIGLSRDIPDY